MITTSVFPGRYIQGYGSINRLGPEIARLGKSGYIFCSPTVFNKILPTFTIETEKYVRINASCYRGDCLEEEIPDLCSQVTKVESDVIIGMGGGKTLDIAKAIAHHLKKPAIMIPSVASSDAPCSGVSVMHNLKGEFHPLRLIRNPDVVLVDTKIIAEAPVKFLVAGMGDSLSHRFEAESCRITCSPNETFTGDAGSSTGYAIARMCYDTIIEYGLAAKKACEVHAVIPALEHVIEAAILQSGLGFENSGLAGCHGLLGAFSFLGASKTKLHGELVAFGTLVDLFLTDRKGEVINEVYNFCESVGLPTTLEDINLIDVTDAELFKAAELVCRKGSNIHNEPVKVTREAVTSAIKIADHEGKLRKNT